MKTFSTLFKESFNLYKTNFKFFTSIILLSNFIGMILNGIVRGFSPNILTIFYSGLANVALISIFYIVSWFLIILGSIATVIAIKGLKQGQKESIASVYNQAIKLFLPVLVVFIIQTLIILGGYLLLIVPGVLFSIWYTFSLYAAVIHKKRKTEALALSKAVVRTSLWRVIGYMLLVGIISSLPYIPFYLMIKKGILHVSLPYLLGIIISGITGSILTVWVISFSFIFYNDLIKANPKISEEFELEAM